MSHSQIEKTLRQLYWIHVELFSMHRKHHEQGLPQIMNDVRSDGQKGKLYHSYVLLLSLLTRIIRQIDAKSLDIYPYSRPMQAIFEATIEEERLARESQQLSKANERFT